MRKLGSRGSSSAERAEIGLCLLLLIVAAQLAGSVVLARSASTDLCGASGGICHVR